MTDEGRAKRGTAIGRPVTPSHPEIAGKFRIYSGSVVKPCRVCDRPTWFGPRLTEMIDRGEAWPACADCMVDAMTAGYWPRSVVDLGNPE